MPPLSHLISLQKPAVRAAAKVGVRWILPSEFGPDPFASKLIEENILLKHKKEIRDLIDELGVSSWVSIAIGSDLAKYKNKAVYTPSFRLSQREILQAVQRATGTTNADWEIATRDYKDVTSEYEENIKKGDGTAPFIIFVTQFVEGLGGDFDNKVDIAELNKLEKLGLRKENLEEVIKVALT
ncbi:hypothetical protein VE00_11071, partial [Pseudogymnoascus sp. WSF 3629]